MNTIAQIADVRTEGSLKKDSSDSGFLTDDQLSSALSRAQSLMLLRVGTDYETIRDYAGVDVPTLDKQAAYKKAECCFTLAMMPLTLTVAQLAKTGLVKTRKIGESTITLTSPQETEDLRVRWEHQAYLALAPYIGNKIFGDDLEPDGVTYETIGFRTKDRKLSIVGI